MHARNSSLSSYLADRIGEIQEARLSNEDRLNVRQHLVDALASAFIGFRNLTVQKLIRLCPKTKEGCSWLGGGKKKVSPLDGGMVWAVAVNGSVFEDGSREGACHPGAVVIPTVIALSEGKDWDRIERAILAGYEVMVRMARGGNPEFTRRGFHPTAIVAPFGAAAAASVLSGYNPEQTRSALSLAAMGGAGLMVSFRRGETQPLQVGGSVRNGILAALIAGMGGSGFERILEEGFFPAYLGGPPQTPLDAPLEFGYALKGSYLKAYPGCRHVHPSIDALDRILRENPVEFSKVESIRVGTYRVAIETEIHEVKSRGDAYFNIPYALAARGILGRSDWNAFGEEHLRNELLLEAMKRVKVAIDPEWESRYPHQRGASVKVTLKDGVFFPAEVNYALGEPENPLPLSRTLQKFHDTAGDTLSAKMRRRIESLLEVSGVTDSPKDLFDAMGEVAPESEGAKHGS